MLGVVGTVVGLFGGFFFSHGLGRPSARAQLVALLGAVLANGVGAAYFVAIFPAACNVFFHNLNNYNVLFQMRAFKCAQCLIKRLIY